MRKAIISGITGQDGSYLADLLIEKGYEVHGIIRRVSTFNLGRIGRVFIDPDISSGSVTLHYGDLCDCSCLHRILAAVQPDEFYNLAAQSHVRVSFDQAEYTADVVATGTLRVLEALREYQSQSGKCVRLYQAGSSEMFGSAPPPQNEATPFHPRSPYAVSKVAAHWYTINYREAYGLFASNGILFNHESPRRGENFVTRKITRGLARIKLGLQDELLLGNLDAKRDWGYAGDYVEAMWRMLQAPAPGDYVVATGEAHSVREFLDATAEFLGIDWHSYVRVDPRYLRPSEVDYLRGDASKMERDFGWRPKTTFPELVRLMAEHDLDRAQQERLLRDAGHGPASFGEDTLLA